MYEYEVGSSPHEKPLVKDEKTELFVVLSFQDLIGAIALLKMSPKFYTMSDWIW